MSEWKSIESAPKDGTSILVAWKKSGNMMVVSWENDSEITEDYNWADHEGDCYHKDAFSHWMTLPEPPTEKRDE